MTASPCINICRMDNKSGLCVGCFRTLDEIADWSRADEAARQAVLAAVAERRRKFASQPEFANHGR
jgi:predicted Fe-S protein YdhL (DUF1289 family)